MGHKQTDTPPGGIEVICGCMFAGKTARLIERLRAARAAGQRTLAFKHALDSRYAPTELATHDGRYFPAQTVAELGLLETCAAAAEVIGIDEGQFFGRGLVAVCERLCERRRRVIIAGIDHNAWGRPFPPFPQLKEIADSVELMHAPCGVCGEPARYSQRVVPVVGGQMVGGPGEYEPRCPNCFVPLPGPCPDE
ncbi:MAG: thymidine kinase [Phycisphaerae bacterium]